MPLRLDIPDKVQSHRLQLCVDIQSGQNACRLIHPAPPASSLGAQSLMAGSSPACACWEFLPEVVGGIPGTCSRLEEEERRHAKEGIGRPMWESCRWIAI